MIRRRRLGLHCFALLAGLDFSVYRRRRQLLNVRHSNARHACLARPPSSSLSPDLLARSSLIIDFREEKEEKHFGLSDRARDRARATDLRWGCSHSSPNPNSSENARTQLHRNRVFLQSLVDGLEI